MTAPDPGEPSRLVALLRSIELFGELDERQLAWLAETGTTQTLRDNEVLFEDGQFAEYFYVLLSGELLITKLIDGREQVVGRHNALLATQPDPSELAGGKPTAAHQFTGELPLLAGGGYVARATSVGPSELLVYPRPVFLEIIARYPVVCRILLPVLAWRIRSYEAQAARRAMVEGLGTLAAGLAHELNNPAAAVVRAASEAGAIIPTLADAATEWGRISLAEERRAIDRMVDRARESSVADLDALAVAEQTDAVLDWLIEHHIDASDIAEVLAPRGFTPAGLDELAGQLRREVLGAALRLLALRIDASTLTDEVSHAGHAISTLIGSVAAYANLGRAPSRTANIVEGIESTLTMLGSFLFGIQVVRDYQELPELAINPVGLNQVWTNLIRNAVDAMRGMPGPKILRVLTCREGDRVVVEVRDNGPGIPDQVRPRLFQPFFTTKDVGSGIGLGLYLSNEIITGMHCGSLDVASVPGDTRFVVRLPITT